MSQIDELLANNEAYAAQFDKGDLPLPPGRKIAIVACMDARVSPYALLGLSEGDAHVIRNAGGVITADQLGVPGVVATHTRTVAPSTGIGPREDGPVLAGLSRDAPSASGSRSPQTSGLRAATNLTAPRSVRRRRRRRRTLVPGRCAG